MRRVLVVLLVLVSSVLLLQAPAFGFHRYFQVHSVSTGDSGTLSIETDCPANSQFVLKSAQFNLGSQRGSETFRVPTGHAIGTTAAGDKISRFQFRTEKLSSQATGTATFSATCDGDPLRAGKAYSKPPKSMQTLPLTGVPALPLLALGLGLVLAGGVLIALGRTGGSSPGRS